MLINIWPVLLSMDSIEHAGDRETKKELRKEHPSGWLYLTQHDAIPILVDALLDLPPNREFNKTELAEHAGVTRQTVGNYTDILLEVELIEEVPDTSPRRYRVADSDVVRELFELNSALNSVGGKKGV
jgi:DNA-binding MarR family transcriptional regulator